ncbi:MAG: type II toxin-antitoxin system HigB family toxin [Dokdonella sp.]
MTSMRIIALSTLKTFWGDNPQFNDAENATLSLYRQVSIANWSSPAELKAEFRNASVLRDGCAVFNIAGNKYRVVVWINYAYQVVYVRFIGTHKQYDAIEAQTI